jgi:transcriptional activator
MLALYRCGRQADALDAYRDARRVLVAEVGV